MSSNKDNVVSLDAKRKKVLQQKTFVNLPEEVDPETFFARLFKEGSPINALGLDFGLEGVPAVALTRHQVRSMGTLMLLAADSMDELAQHEQYLDDEDDDGPGAA